MSYENAIAMYRARKGHKLEEWHVFCDWVSKLPYFDSLFPETAGDIHAS
jgi:hypothetical protein